jgi:site-specific DNA-methyltransferase (adenine-specific)
MEEIKNKIICGDCLEVLKTWPDNFIDCVITSPPYDNLRNYDGYTFNFEEIAKELFRVLKTGGVVVWVVGDATIDGSETGTSFRQALYFKEIGLSLYDTMIYQKIGNPSPQRPEIRYLQCFEYMFVFCKGKRPKTINLLERETVKGKTSLQRKSKRQRDGSMLRGVFMNREKCPLSNVWLIDASNGAREATHLHTAAFPNIIPERHIKSWSNEGDIVLDPMCGSGTTCKMAKILNRNFIGIDISEKYCKIAEQRLKQDLLF